MTTFDYLKSRATAEKLIAKFGQTGALRRVSASGPAYDPITTTNDYTVKLVDLDYDETQISGTLITRGDRRVYLSTIGLSIVPANGDKILIGGVEHAILGVKPLQPSGTIVFWELQARK